MSSLQWFACAEGYRYLHRFIIKELCIQCIQTGEYFTFHPYAGCYCDVDPHNPQDAEIIDYSIKCRHGLKWNAGTCTQADMKEQVLKFIDRYTQVYTTDP